MIINNLGLEKQTCDLYRSKKVHEMGTNELKKLLRSNKVEVRMKLYVVENCQFVLFLVNFTLWLHDQQPVNVFN